jgi:hypothetical protein
VWHKAKEVGNGRELGKGGEGFCSRLVEAKRGIVDFWLSQRTGVACESADVLLELGYPLGVGWLTEALEAR